MGKAEIPGVIAEGYLAKTTRQRLIDVATDLFYRNGFHAIGLDRILVEAGLTKTTFYNHFESKDELVLAVIEEQDRLERDQFELAMHKRGGDCPRRQLLSVFDALHAWFNESEYEGCMFIHAAAEFPMSSHPVHQAAARHKQAFRDALVVRAVRAGAPDPQRLAEQVAILFEGALVSRYVTGNDQAAMIALRAAEALLDHDGVTGDDVAAAAG